jgi:hypothetical protein
MNKHPNLLISQIFFIWGWRRPNLRLLSFQGSEFN